MLWFESFYLGRVIYQYAYSSRMKMAKLESFSEESKSSLAGFGQFNLSRRLGATGIIALQRLHPLLISWESRHLL